jgi:hypothetical protein
LPAHASKAPPGLTSHESAAAAGAVVCWACASALAKLAEFDARPVLGEELALGVGVAESKAVCSEATVAGRFVDLQTAGGADSRRARARGYQRELRGGWL